MISVQLKMFCLVVLLVVGMGVQAQELVEYKRVDSVSLKLEIHKPASLQQDKTYPAMVFFFGGGWNSGTRKQFLQHAKYFSARGIVCFLADYRVKNRNKTTPFESLKDAKSAMRFVRKHAATYQIDTTKIIASGGSAGGHLAAATALIEAYNEASDDLSISCKPHALVLFNPVVDNGPKGYGYERIGDAYKAFSPLHNITKNTPPTIFFLGTKDHLVPVATGKAYKAALDALDIPCELKLYAGGKHGFFNYKKKKPGIFNSTVRQADDFLTSLGFIAANSRAKADIKAAEKVIIDTQAEWRLNAEQVEQLEIAGGMLVPTDSVATFRSVITHFGSKRTLQSITFSQSSDWLNWQPVPKVVPPNLGDAPVALQLGKGNYWLFGKYQQNKAQKNGSFKAKQATVAGFDLELKTTPYPNQFDAPGGLQPAKGGYHAWQSHDMKTWVHHGPVSEYVSRWMTTAEYVDGKAYLYYDFPNDQDPHLYIDDNLFDGKPGKNMGMVFNDATHGSDCAVIRDLAGKFHIIAEDWSPIRASARAWDSPLAVHASSPDGINNFSVMTPPVDYRTNPTGQFAEYPHPHWHKEAPDRFPSKATTENHAKHKIKAGDKRAFAQYEMHEPKQNAFGDWAAIAIGGQYYLFGDYDLAGKHGGKNMRVAWFTSNDINKPFRFCGSMGQGHPDPDIIFAAGKFYLLTQTKQDFVSTGPWVDTVELRLGVDTDKDGAIDYWSDWQNISERYACIAGFAKQIKKSPAQLVEPSLPEGYGFQFEVKITDTTPGKAKPILDNVHILFGK